MIEDGPFTRKGPAPIINPVQLYDEAQQVDEWPGTDYDGTSVRAGMKVLRKRGLISAYRWAWDIATVTDALLYHGPVVLGTNWYSSMFDPDSSGFVRIGGGLAGGHAYVLNGVNLDTGTVRAKNSWGRAWGQNGFFRMDFDTVARLLEEWGEAAIATEV
jgi:hypothetical protein